jgi:diguanylate cyclase (GGDEF)-like protein
MSGIATFVFALALAMSLGLVYAAGMTGWVISACLLAAGSLATLFFGWADPAILAVEVVAAGFTLWLGLRWTHRHGAWQARTAKDLREANETQLQLQGVVQALRERIVQKAGDVDRGLKQYELIKRLAEVVSWEEMSPSIERALKHFFHVDGWALYLANTKGDLELVQRRGVPPEARAADLMKKEPYLHTFVPTVGADQGRAMWALGMPLWRLHERIGLLMLRIPEMAPDAQPAVLADASTFAVQMIFAMAKARLYRELEQRSRTDGLTGLSRRGPFEERLKEEVARGTSFRSTFSILMIDIDHFKNLNDTYGHQMGDEVLRTVSQRLREGLYETDVIARYGGEEFVCLLPRSDPAGLRIKADQLRQRVSNQAFVIGLEAVQVTISIGIAHFPHDGQTPDAVLSAADRALYAAKHAGRNCIVEAASIPNAS